MLIFVDPSNPTKYIKGMPREVSIEMFAKELGGKTSADIQGHIHAGLRSAPQTKTYRRFFERVLKELQDSRDRTLELYQAAIERGDIVPPKPQTLEEVAQGEGPAAEAAQRVLLKRACRRERQDSPSISVDP